ncbi:UGA2 Succinate-semialdehyde dehydrogenase [NADP(+)] [Candida maltosa Xu316]
MVSKSTIESSAKVLSTFSNPNLIKTDGFANGKWIKSSSGETFKVTNPALYPNPEGEIATVQSLSVDDYKQTIDDAYTAFQKFKRTTGRSRSDLLLKLYNLMIENKEDLAKLVVLENGKPYADALGEVAYAASFFQWFSEEAPRIYGDIIPSANGKNRILTFKQPVGVCGILTPWNFPLAMITRKVGAAVATGCTTVIRPASETPLSALALAYLAEKAGFPPGVINVLPCARSSVVGKLITEHPLIKKVSFTGSTPVGKILMEQSASTLKKLSFELGGNAPFIVFEDADIDKAIAGVIISKFRSSGQTCVCANRVFVHEKVYDEFSKKLVEKLSQTVMGNGLDPQVTHGPVVNEKSMKKVREHIDDAVGKGAKILFGGEKRPDLGANFHDLTLLGDVTPEMVICHDETFGPVAPLIKFSTDEEVIQMANDTNVGLAGYFFSQDVGKVFKIAEELNVGMIGVNTGAISESALPFGGVGESGFGREGSKYGVDDYLVIKSAVLGNIE